MTRRRRSRPFSPRSGERIRVRRLGSPPETVLARAEPSLDAEDASVLRARVAESAGARPSPRIEPLASIEVPLDVRVQAALFFDLPESVQSELSGAGAPLCRSRGAAEQGERCIVSLGIDEGTKRNGGDDD